MITSKFVYLRQTCSISGDANATEPEIHLYEGEVHPGNSYQYEAMIPFVSATSTPVQGIPSSLRAAYKYFKRLYEATGGHHVHRYARELYEKSFASGHFICWPQSLVIKGCLLIAFSDTRSPLYAPQCKALAPRTKREGQIFETLQQFFVTPLCDSNRSRMDQTAETFGFSKPLLSAYEEIQAFCDCLCLPSSVASYAKFLFNFVYERGDYEMHEIDALIIGCFYIACRQMKMPKNYLTVRSLTSLQISEIQAIVKNLEDYFSAQHTVEKREQDLSGDPPWGPGYVSAFDVTNSLQGLEYQDPGRVRIVYTIYNHERDPGVRSTRL